MATPPGTPNNNNANEMEVTFEVGSPTSATELLKDSSNERELRFVDSVDDLEGRVSNGGGGVLQMENEGVDTVDKLPKNLRFSCWDICSLLYSMLLYVFDVGSDTYLAYFYFRHGRYEYFAVTVAFIAVPAVIQTALSLRWYIHDADAGGEMGVVSLKRWTVRVICLILQLGPLLRYVDSLCYGLKFRLKRRSLFTSWKSQEPLSKEECNEMYRLMVYEDADALLLRIFECFLEAIPQMLLQFYILTNDAIHGEQNPQLIFLQVLAIITALISVAWTMASYHRHMRFCREEKKNISFLGTTLQIAWFLSILTSRILALGLFASVYNLWVLVACGIHWVVMGVFMVQSKTEFCRTKLEEFLFDFLLAFVYIFIFYNVSDERTRFKYTFYYIFTFVSNTVMISLWFFNVDQDIWFKYPGFAGQFCAFFLGILIMLTYYIYFHPTGIKPLDLRDTDFFAIVSKPFYKKSRSGQEHPDKHTGADVSF